MDIKRYIAGFLFLVVGTTSCISDFNADLPYTDEDILVVECDIVANSEVDIILSKTFGLSAEELPNGYNEVQATVTLRGSDGFKSSAASYMGKGVHRLTVGALDSEVDYSLEIEYKGNTYESIPQKPLFTSEIESVSWEQKENKGDVAMCVSTSPANAGSEYYMWTYIEDWEYTALFYTIDFYDPETRKMVNYPYDPYYYCWKNRIGDEILVGSTEALSTNRIENFQLCKHESSNDRFSWLYSIRVKQMAISKAAYEYYKDLAKLSNDMGGLFTPQPSELKGNIQCVNDKSMRVIGYVGIAQNIAEEQLYISYEELDRNAPVYNCFYFSKEDASKEMANLGIPGDFHSFYVIFNYWPLQERLLDSDWASALCVDCRRMGGTKEKPAFWPNDHL